MERVADVTSFNTAEISDLFPRKGTIQVTSDADLGIVDLDLSRGVEVKMLQSRSTFSPYKGPEFEGMAGAHHGSSKSC